MYSLHPRSALIWALFATVGACGGSPTEPPPPPPPTLNTRVEANPVKGYAPLRGVNIRVDVSGTAQGTIRYRFDCTNDGRFEKDTTAFVQPVTTCDYETPGSYMVCVLVERQGVTAQACAPPITVLETPLAGKRAIMDRPEGVFEGWLVHLVLMLPSDGIDPGLDTNGVIETFWTVIQNWVINQTGGKMLPEDIFGGRPDITLVRAARPDTEFASQGANAVNEIWKELQAAGLNNPKKKYLVLYHGKNRGCGSGMLNGPVAALYNLGGATLCERQFAPSPTSPPGFPEFAGFHELGHTFGLVDTRAPNHNPNAPSHTMDDRRCVMYTGLESWTPELLDPRNDDYYFAGGIIPAGFAALDPILVPAPASRVAAARASAAAYSITPREFPSLGNDAVMWKR